MGGFRASWGSLLILLFPCIAVAAPGSWTRFPFGNANPPRFGLCTGVSTGPLNGLVAFGGFTAVDKSAALNQVIEFGATGVYGPYSATAGVPASARGFSACGVTGSGGAENFVIVGGEFAGGSPTFSDEVHRVTIGDSATRWEWTQFATLPSAVGAAAAATDDQKASLFVFGGYSGAATVTDNLFEVRGQPNWDVVDRTSAQSGTPAARAHAVLSTALGISRFVLTGGVLAGGTFSADVFIFDGQSFGWSQQGPLPSARAGHFAGYSSDGYLSVGWGEGSTGFLGDLYRWHDPVVSGPGSWDFLLSTGEKPVNAAYMGQDVGFVSTLELMFFSGGQTQAGILASTYLLEVAGTFPTTSSSSTTTTTTTSTSSSTSTSTSTSTTVTATSTTSTSGTSTSGTVTTASVPRVESSPAASSGSDTTVVIAVVVAITVIVLCLLCVVGAVILFRRRKQNHFIPAEVIAPQGQEYEDLSSATGSAGYSPMGQTRSPTLSVPAQSMNGPRTTMASPGATHYSGISVGSNSPDYGTPALAGAQTVPVERDYSPGPSLMTSSAPSHVTSSPSYGGGSAAVRSYAASRSAEWDIDYKSVEFGQEIGSGAFGSVFKGKWRGIDVAVKVLKIDENMTIGHVRELLDEFKAESALVKALRPHQHVVQCFGAAGSEAQLAIVSEFCGFGSLHSYISEPRNVLGADLAIKWARGISAGLLHCHLENIIHRDMAARNVLLSEGMIPKISDFGMSRVLVESAADTGSTAMAATTVTNVGPLRWMAPEALVDRLFSRRTDVWSLGAVFFEILNRTAPYPGMEAASVSAKVAMGRLRLIPEFVERRKILSQPGWEGRDRVVDAFSSLIDAAQTFDSAQRPDIPQLQPWLDSLDQ